MNHSLRILTINENEEAIIKVNSSIPVTLDFNGMSITLYYRDGWVFQKVEPTPMHNADDKIEPADLGPLVETQPMNNETPEFFVETQPMDNETPEFHPTPFPRPDYSNVTNRIKKISKKDIQDIADLQKDLFGAAGDTQIEDYDA